MTEQHQPKVFSRKEWEQKLCFKEPFKLAHLQAETDGACYCIYYDGEPVALYSFKDRRWYLSTHSYRSAGAPHAIQDIRQTLIKHGAKADELQGMTKDFFWDYLTTHSLHGLEKRRAAK